MLLSCQFQLHYTYILNPRTVPIATVRGHQTSVCGLAHCQHTHIPRNLAWIARPCKAGARPQKSLRLHQAEDLFAAPPTPTALIEHGPSFHGNDDGVGHSNEVASESDHGLVEDPPVLTSLVTCGAEHFVLPRRAAALAASRVDFSCIFQRAGGCVSNLRRRKQ